MRRRWRRPGRRGKVWVMVLLGGLALLAALEWRLKPAMERLAVAQAQWVATEAIQKAVLERIAGEVKYNDLIQPASDEGRQVVFMEADVLRISELQAEAQLAIQEKLSELKGRRYPLPLGQLLGWHVVAALGPPIPLSFVPMGTVSVTLGDSFEAAGINQTRHRIYLQVESNVQVIAPLLAEEVRVESRIPVAEAIIVGPVPQTYLSFNMEPGKGILHSPSF
ncbi:MAG TPA: sporulation protein YunB [Peptococcaceae bacterium]|nr:MAG: hypothetical protein XD51_1208 [Moorella sp. 60_41]HBT48207.1 sporulation protein YunB [Peptococcaceae bacterium]